jgi:tetratricopeptide (TPR) repeat protein
MPVSMPGTSRAELTSTVADMTARLAAAPNDALAVLHLSNALLRLQRVNNDGRAVVAAEEHLRAFLDRAPGHYEARRMLAAVLLSQHRFADAIAEAERARAVDPRDGWNYGVIGDGYLELGDYERAFAAFDQMGRLAPGPPAYARVAYALELQGDLEGALDYMRRAADGTTPNDPESLAWHFSQVGGLLLQMGRLVEARLAFERAAATFPDHPLAVQGLASIRVLDGDPRAARLLLQALLAKSPAPDLAAAVGDLSMALGDAEGAAPYFRMAEQIERAAWDNGPRQPQHLARFLVDRDRQIGEAVALAEEAARLRRDIFTMDTVAAAYWKAGRIDEARRASEAALRTGTRDARILWHAAEIAAAAGDSASARALLGRIPDLRTIADRRVNDGVHALLSRLGT